MTPRLVGTRRLRAFEGAETKTRDRARRVLLALDEKPRSETALRRWFEREPDVAPLSQQGRLQAFGGAVDYLDRHGLLQRTGVLIEPSAAGRAELHRMATGGGGAP